MLGSALRFLVGLIYPRCCEICGQAPSSAGTDPSWICALCRGRIHPLRPPFCVRCGRPAAERRTGCAGCAGETFHFDAAYACAYYEGPMKELLQRYKFSGRKALSGFFSSEALSFARRHLSGERLDAVAAVPLDRGRLWGRGFNQTAPLARHLSRGLGLADLSHLLGRRPSSSAQSSLGKADRAANVEGRFFLKGPLPKDARSLLLVDDILTTGRTASECARILKRGGAASVSVLACARGR